MAASIAIDGRMINQPQCHGIARVTIEFLRRLPADRDRRVVLIMAEGATSKFDIDDLGEHADVVHTTSVIGRPYDVRHLRGVLREVGAGVLFAPYHALAPLPVGVPLVVGVHDCILESDRRLADSWSMGRMYRLNTHRVLAQAVAAVAPSRTTAEAIPAFYRAAPPTRVCPNGVEAAAWNSVDGDNRLARLGLPARFILHVGARRPHKNQRVLVEALTAVDESVSLVLLGAGDPRVRDEIDAVAAEHGVSHRVITLDGIDDATLRAVYAGALAFVFPSIAEGYGLPPLEAMAAGTPVIASAIPVMAEVCQTAALLVSPYEAGQWAAAITRVLTDDDLRKSMVADGFRVVAETTWDKGATALYALLDEVAGTHDVRRSG